MKTIIYSCGGDTTSQQLVENTAEMGVDVYFPETIRIGDSIMPLLEWEQVALLPNLIGKRIVTVSEIIILMFLREVRKGRMRTDELELYCDGRRIGMSTDGSMIDPWDGGFFETGINLRFD